MSQSIGYKARYSGECRAFSLLELTVVLVLVGLVAAAAIGRFGHETLQNLDAEGYARRLALDLTQARQATIASGDNHYLSLTESGGNVTSYAMFRTDAGGDVQVTPDAPTPTGLTVTASHTTLEFDFDGTALGAYDVDVAGPHRSWSVTSVPLTGLVRTAETTP